MQRILKLFCLSFFLEYFNLKAFLNNSYSQLKEKEKETSDSKRTEFWSLAPSLEQKQSRERGESDRSNMDGQATFLAWLDASS